MVSSCRFAAPDPTLSLSPCHTLRLLTSNPPPPPCLLCLPPPCCRWFMQLLLPVNVYSLVHEKEHHLRMMMKMQVWSGVGLDNWG